MYHCFSRCVRGAFLCGYDRQSGRNYRHRKRYLERRLRELTRYFCVKTVTATVQCNHHHTIVRTDPVAAGLLSAQEVLDRWRAVMPYKLKESEREEGLEGLKYRAELLDPQIIEEYRQRLNSVSWLMRLLKEPLARMANLEDGCKGHFWEGRFKCVRLDDAAALLACMSYVELNPIRAGVADRLENCDYTTIQERMKEYKERARAQRLKKYKRILGSEVEARLLERWASRKVARAQWLYPLEKLFEGWQGRSGGIELGEYLELVDWSGRCSRREGEGRIPEHLAGILERLEANPEFWGEVVEEYGGLFHVVAAKASRLRELARQAGKRCYWGVKLKVPLYRE